MIAKNPSDSSETIKVYVTNKDRFSRFGMGYVEIFAPFHNTEIVVLDDDETKEPYEILLEQSRMTCLKPSRFDPLQPLLKPGKSST